MGLLTRINPAIRAGLSAQTVRLITGEPEPEVQAYKAEKVVVETAHYHKAAQLQVSRILKDRQRRKPKGRG
jgi:hypothetical protein